MPLALLLLALATAEGRLPVARVTTAQGLVSDRITHVMRDSRGFLWIGTRDGLSRYDGQRFVNYDTPFVTTITETRRGVILVATLDGLFRLAEDAQRLEHIARGIGVNDVIEDRSGTVWAACDKSLCRLQGDALVRDPGYEGATVRVLAASDELWVGTEQGLQRRRATGAWERYVVDPHRGTDIVHGLSVDRRGRLWIGTSFGFFVAQPDALRSPLREHVPFTSLTRDDAALVMVRTPFHGADATWLPTSLGIVRIDDRGMQLLDARAGVGDEPVNALAEDVAGNLWSGGELGGLTRITRAGVTTFTRAHGLPDDRINSIVETDAGLCATATRWLHCFENGSITSREIIPSGLKFAGWGWGQVVAHDASGDWWVATGQGVVRWSNDLDRIVARYDSRDGLGGDDVFRVWGDSRGDLWFSTFGERVLTRRDHESGKFVTYGDVPRVAPTVFAEDRQGTVWMGLYTGGLLRYDGSRFTKVASNIPAGFVSDLLVDSRGTLWIAASGGVGRIPGGMVRTAGARSLAETADGKIAIGSAHGVDILDPATARVVTHVSTADGLPQNLITVLHRDRAGALWFGTPGGLSRWNGFQSPDRTPASLPVARIDSVSGVRLAELGARAIGPIRLAWPDHRMTVTFSAPDFDPRNPLRFEYRLSGDEKWTSAGSRRTVSYERLPFGEQRFDVRVAGSKDAASVSMNVIPPVWRRWWFVALAAALIAAAAVLFHRMRVRQLLAIQEMRMRVATDLHDDLGSSLSRISILSEVAKSRTSERVLDEIGDTARGLVDALGDSIWSIDPRRDDLRSVFARVRHFAAELLEARSMTMDFDVPESLATVQLTPEKRRELFLILKEAINNAAKHSNATRVAIAARVENARLLLRVEDDGVGFTGPREGHGLPSMAARAQRAGGAIDIVSRPDGGTRIDVSVPV